MEMIMPNKTIYVSDDDLPLFERAQQVSGDNLSSAIVRALRRFVEVEEARKKGFEEITVLVGKAGNLQQKRFLGARLARWLREHPKGKGTQILIVYRTAGGRLALQTQSIPNWEYGWGDPDYASDPENRGFLGSKFWGKVLGAASEWEYYKVSSDYSFEVFEGLEEIRPHIPKNLYKVLEQVMEGPPVEDLDI